MGETNRILKWTMAAWLAIRLAAVLQAAVAWHLQAPVEGARWIAVLGGEGEARTGAAARLAASLPDARILLVGTEPEIRFMGDLLAGKAGRLEAVPVAEASTYGCMRALVAAVRGPGVVVTSAGHGPRALVSWFLAGGGRPPGIEATGTGGPDRTELAKLVWYLVRY